MGKHHGNQFPGESADYRIARDALLEREIELREQLAEVAKLRRDLPPGGSLKEDYVFEEGARDLTDESTRTKTRFSELFSAGKNSLFVYSFMYPPDADQGCPMCTSFLDGLNGSASHIGDRMNIAVVAKAPIGKIRSWGRGRGWHNLRLLSSGGTSYNADYFAEHPEWGQMPAINVFRKQDEEIRHFYSAELLYSTTAEGQHPRHADLLCRSGTSSI